MYVYLHVCTLHMLSPEITHTCKHLQVYSCTHQQCTQSQSLELASIHEGLLRCIHACKTKNRETKTLSLTLALAHTHVRSNPKGTGVCPQACLDTNTNTKTRLLCNSESAKATQCDTVMHFLIPTRSSCVPSSLLVIALVFNLAQHTHIAKLLKHCLHLVYSQSFVNKQSKTKQKLASIHEQLLRCMPAVSKHAHSHNEAQNKFFGTHLQI
jgi:hypothetical protein